MKKYDKTHDMIAYTMDDMEHQSCSSNTSSAEFCCSDAYKYKNYVHLWILWSWHLYTYGDIFQTIIYMHLFTRFSSHALKSRHKRNNRLWSPSTELTEVIRLWSLQPNSDLILLILFTVAWWNGLWRFWSGPVGLWCGRMWAWGKQEREFEQIQGQEM